MQSAVSLLWLLLAVEGWTVSGRVDKRIWRMLVGVEKLVDEDAYRSLRRCNIFHLLRVRQETC